MSSELLEEWVCELDRKFCSDKRKVTLIIGNCKAHPHVKHLEWVELIFTLPNTSSVTQPMDQEIIHLLKAKYCSLLVRRLISSLEKNAWNTLPDKTFTDYFPKCGISEEAVASATADNDNPFAGLEEDNKDARDQDLENRFTILEN